MNLPSSTGKIYKRISVAFSLNISIRAQQHETDCTSVYVKANGNGTIKPIHYTYSFRDKNCEYKFLKHSLETSTEDTVKVSSSKCLESVKKKAFSPNTGKKQQLVFLLRTSSNLSLYTGYYV
jgi:hypothetical protein